MARPRSSKRGSPQFVGSHSLRWSGAVIDSIGARAAPGALRVRVGAIEIPERFTASYTQADSSKPDFVIEMVVEDGQLVCASVWCRRKEGGGSVTATGYREIALETVIKAATGLVATDTSGEPLAEDGRVSLDQVFASYRRSAEGHGRGQRLSDDHLRAVADVYRSAIAIGAAPTEAVRRMFSLYSRSTAGRQVGLARDRGFLEEWGQQKREGEA